MPEAREIRRRKVLHVRCALPSMESRVHGNGVDECRGSGRHERDDGEDEDSVPPVVREFCAVR